MRAQKQLNLGGIIYDDEYNEMKESGDLDLLANVTCPENQREIHQALLEQAGHIVTNEGNVEQQAGAIASESGVVQQEGEIAGQGGDIVGQEGDMITQDGEMVRRENDIAPPDGNIVTAEDTVVAGTNHITEDEVAMDHEQEVTATIQIDQPNGLCEQPMQVGELVEQECLD